MSHPQDEMPAALCSSPSLLLLGDSRDRVVYGHMLTKACGRARTDGWRAWTHPAADPALSSPFASSPLQGPPVQLGALCEDAAPFAAVAFFQHYGVASDGTYHLVQKGNATSHGWLNHGQWGWNGAGWKEHCTRAHECASATSSARHDEMVRHATTRPPFGQLGSAPPRADSPSLIVEAVRRFRRSLPPPASSARASSCAIIAFSSNLWDMQRYINFFAPRGRGASYQRGVPLGTWAAEWRKNYTDVVRRLEAAVQPDDDGALRVAAGLQGGPPRALPPATLVLTTSYPTVYGWGLSNANVEQLLNSHTRELFGVAPGYWRGAGSGAPAAPLRSGTSIRARAARMRTNHQPALPLHTYRGRGGAHVALADLAAATNLATNGGNVSLLRGLTQDMSHPNKRGAALVLGAIARAAGVAWRS